MTDLSRTLSAHTPEPWIEFADQGETVALMPAMREGDVCVFAKPYPRAADARLMRTAPELLKAARLAEKAIALIIANRPQNELAPTNIALAVALEHIRAAIAKAESRT